MFDYSFLDADGHVGQVKWHSFLVVLTALLLVVFSATGFWLNFGIGFIVGSFFWIIFHTVKYYQKRDNDEYTN